MTEDELTEYYTKLILMCGACSECGQPLCICGVCHSCADLGNFEIDERIFEKEE
jgi:hypothetical protein